MPSLKDKVFAIARDVGIPSEVFDAGDAAAVLRAACDAMGMVPKQRHTLPDIAEMPSCGSSGLRAQLRTSTSTVCE